jgi:iron complex outermembrane recepter protein
MAAKIAHRLRWTEPAWVHVCTDAAARRCHATIDLQRQPQGTSEESRMNRPAGPCGLNVWPLWAALAIASPLAALAQEAAPEVLPVVVPPPPAAEPQRVEITGSRIKRIEGETALPVQVIRRQDIEKMGVTTASELLARVAANSNSLTDGGSINVGGYDQKGFNSANLRGIGSSSTLVLLNGRRMANFASPGDESGVDLNNIPAAAIDRVEILLDGASAVYGTDAIAGVMNFITRKDYRGAEISAYLGATQEGGGGKRSASIAAGTGDVATDGFNVFGVIDVQHTDSLRTSQRDFIAALQVPQRLPYLLSSYTSPANIRLSSDQRDYLQSVGFEINGKPIVNRTINLSQPACNPPANLYLPTGTGGEDACTYDYMRDTELYPQSEKLGFLGRGVLQLGADHQLFAELSLTRAKTDYVGSSARVTGVMDVSLIPTLAATGLASIDPEIEVRTRLTEAGNRRSTLTSEGQRIVLGASGTLAGWDVDTAFNHSVSTVKDADTHGYLLYDQLIEGIANGVINPFGPSGPDGVALIDSIQVNDVVRWSQGTMDAVDVKASRPLMRLSGGDLAIALGGEFRIERQRYRPSPLYASDNINNDFVAGETEPTDHSRKVAAVYAELDAPITTEWELQFAARFDKYEGVGSTTNPKIGLRWQPMKELLLRASAGTGFRAPSLSDLYRPTVLSATSTLPDPVCMAANDNDLSICADNWETHRYSNPDLKPERSRQFSLGLAIEPSRTFSATLDYWNIQKSDLISEIGDDVILGNLDKYGNLVYRYSTPPGAPGSDFMDTCGDFLDPEDTAICFIALRKENRGRQKASGIDITIDMHDVKTDYGTFGARLSGTLALVSKQQTGNDDPYVSNLGKFVTDGVVQRWRHRLSVDWAYGPWALTVGNTFYSGYDDQNSAIDTDTGTVVAPNRVKAYSLWDLSAAYEVSPAFRLRAGVQNLFDTSPPFSNQAFYFLSGYDPSYTDPRGRFFYLSGTYVFR